MGREQLFHKILVFFAVYTAFIGLINLASVGTLTLGDMSALSGGTIPGQYTSGSASSITGYVEGANNAAGTVLSGLDFTTMTELPKNITYMNGYGTWNLVPGQGLTLTRFFLPSGQDQVLLTNVQSSGNIYTVNTQINNNLAGGDFSIFPRFYQLNDVNNLELVFSQDGIHLKKTGISIYFLDSGDDYFYPLINARNTVQGGSIITTVLTEVIATQPQSGTITPELTSKLTVSKDGVQLFSTNVRSIFGGSTSNQVIHHGGAGSEANNFIIVGFPSTPILDTSENIISGAAGAVDQSTDPFAGVKALLAMLGTIFGLTNDPLVPFWVWAIVGLPSIAAIALIYYQMIRGN